MTDAPSAAARNQEIRSIAVLSGGHGGAKLISGLLHGITTGELPGVSPRATVTVIANTADDLWMHGLKICPDIDTLLYTLGGGFDTERGWGRREESWSIQEELAAYGIKTTWFGLGDRDFATHIIRTQLLNSGYSLSQVTEALARRWLAHWHRPDGPQVRLLPMSDDRVETHVAVHDDRAEGGQRLVHFQEYWVRLRAEVPAERLIYQGLDAATPAPGVIQAIEEADLVVIPPSNPVVSVGTILGVAGVRQAVRQSRGLVLGISPIIGGSPVRGMAQQMLTAIGVEVSAAGVGGLYGSRRRRGLLDFWLMDTVDGEDGESIARLADKGLLSLGVPLWMTTPEDTTEFLRAGLLAAREARFRE